MYIKSSSIKPEVRRQESTQKKRSQNNTTVEMLSGLVAAGFGDGVAEESAGAVEGQPEGGRPSWRQTDLCVDWGAGNGNPRVWCRTT